MSQSSESSQAREVSGGGRPSDTSAGTTGSAVPPGGPTPGAGEQAGATPNPGVGAPPPGDNVASDATAPNVSKAPAPPAGEDFTDGDRDAPSATPLEGEPPSA